MATAFKDLGKLAKDLLNKNYPDPKKVGPHLAFGLSSKLKAPEHVTVTTEAYKHPNGDDVSATVEAIFDVPEHKSKATLKLDTEQKYDITLENSGLIEHVTVQLGASFNEVATIGKFDAGFVNEHANIGFEVAYTLETNDVKVTPRLAGTYNDFQAGFTAEVDLHHDDKIRSFASIGSFNDKKHVASAYFNSTTNEKNKTDTKGGLSYYQKYNGEVELGGEVSFKNLNFSSPTISIGSSYKPRISTNVKGRIVGSGTDNIRAGFSIEETFHHFKLQTSYDLNLVQFGGQVTSGSHNLVGQAGHQFGVKFVLD